MSSILLTGPAVEPLSLDEAKTFLRVEHSDDDQVIGARYGVNSGLGRSGKVLRRALKLPDNSSAVTEPVIAAARSIDPRILIVAICDERLHFLQSLKTWSVFGAGWSRRVAEVKSVALAMAADFRPVHG